MKVAKHHLGDLLSDQERAAIRAPIERARTFPDRTFTSDAFFNFEQAKVAGANWVALAFEGQLPEVGDVMPIDAFGLRLLVVRGKDRVVRVFQNRCPYDGCPIVVEPQHGVEQLVVAYHGWIYSLSGELLAAPYWDGTTKGPVAHLADSARLTQVRTGVGLGVVFVDATGTADGLDGALQPLRDELGDYDLDSLAITKSFRGGAAIDRSEVRTNWRTYFENTLNVLHENFTHDIYRKSKDHPRVTADGTKRFRTHQGADMFGFSYGVDDVAAYGPRVLPHIGHGAELPQRSHFFSLYPNFTGAAMAQSLFAVAIVLPQAADRTTTVSATFTAASTHSKLLSGAIHSQLNKGFAEAAREDGRVMEAVQRGRQAGSATTQFFSPFWDDGHHRFTNRLLDDLER